MEGEVSHKKYVIFDKEYKNCHVKYLKLARWFIGWIGSSNCMFSEFDFYFFLQSYKNVKDLTKFSDKRQNFVDFTPCYFLEYKIY